MDRERAEVERAGARRGDRQRGRSPPGAFCTSAPHPAARAVASASSPSRGALRAPHPSSRAREAHRREHLGRLRELDLPVVDDLEEVPPRIVEVERTAAARPRSRPRRPRRGPPPCRPRRSRRGGATSGGCVRGVGERDELVAHVDERHRAGAGRGASAGRTAAPRTRAPRRSSRPRARRGSSRRAVPSTRQRRVGNPRPAARCRDERPKGAPCASSSSQLVALAVLVPATALAGGWATVKLSSTPTGAAAGVPWVVNLTVLQHGVTPLAEHPAARADRAGHARAAVPRPSDREDRRLPRPRRLPARRDVALVDLGRLLAGRTRTSRHGRPAAI